MPRLERGVSDDFARVAKMEAGSMAKKAKAKSQAKTDTGANIGFESKLWLAQQLNEQFAESAKLEAAIRSNLEGLGYRV